MSVFESNRQVPLGSITTFRVVAFFERALDAMRTRYAARATAAALGNLSDRQLADIGIHRGEIAELAEALARG